MRDLLSAPRPFLRNLSLLTITWSLAALVNLMMVSVSVLTGHMLAEDKSLAALPVALQWLGTAASTIPASLLMRRIGRRAGFTVASAIIASGGALAMAAILAGSFWIFCLATTMVGSGMAFNWYYRFAAAEIASQEYRSRAISLVLAGGIVAALLGPTLAGWSRSWFEPTLYAGTYALLIGLSGAIALLLRFVEIPRPAAADLKGGRPLRQIAAQPVFRVAVLGGVVAYVVMILMMSVTPLAMTLHGHAFEDATFVIQWHVLGMYVPSFFTGHLIRRWGAVSIMQTGGGLLFGCLAVALAGDSMLHFWVALALLGIGWNFLFTGSTTLLTETYNTAERAKAQGLNELLIFGATAVGVYFSGALLHGLGWNAVVLLALLPILMTIAATGWLGAQRARAA